MRPRPLSALMIAASLLTGCEASLSVDLTAQGREGIAAVVLAVESVQLLDDDGNVMTLTSHDANPFDLLPFTQGERFNIAGDDGKGGVHYTGIRPVFDVSNAYIDLTDGSRAPLTLGSQASFNSIDLTLSDSSLSDSDATTRVLGIDLHFSLRDRRDTLGVFELHPVMRVTDPDSAGHIIGTLARSLLTNSTCQNGRTVGKGVAVYLYAGADQTPTDYYATDTVTRSNPPLASGMVRYDSSTDRYGYDIPWLTPGNYTLALTCQADQDDPGRDDALEFIRTRSITVSANTTLNSDFE